MTDLSSRVRRVLLGAPFGVLSLLAFAGLDSAVAQNAGSDPDVFERLEEVRERIDDGLPSGRFSVAPVAVEDYVAFKRRLEEDYRFIYNVAPTLMMHRGTHNGADRQNGTADNDNSTASAQVHFVASWQPLENFNGSINLHYMNLRQVTSTTGSEFSQAIGLSGFEINDSGVTTDPLRSLLWRQGFLDDRLVLYFGQGEILQFDNGCRYACDDTENFMATPLSSNPTRTLPGAGAAAAIEIKPIEGLSIGGGVSDARGDGGVNFARIFNEGELAYAGQVAYQPKLSVGEGFYSLSAFYVEPKFRGSPQAQEESRGLQLMLDQDIGEVALFAKFGLAEKRKASAERYASGGLVWLNPFGETEDRLGLGVGWVRPSADDTNDEWVVEGFYRLQMTPALEVTPGAEWIINPSNTDNNSGSNHEGVLNLRATARF